MQQTIDDAERDAIFQKLKASPENNKCFDCDKKNPKWASVYLGLYLCLDCAGKHREYGPQISFARSLNLDTWNQRYITFMELGGNAKALEYFKKQGLKTPYDYKSPLIQKYKQELTKKVDAALSTSNPKEEVSKPVFANKVEEEKPQPQIKAHNDLMGNTLSIKSFSDKPRHQEKEPEDPFANNIVINKGETKTKGFTVEFSKNKSGFGTNKGRIAAKKIDNIDLDSLSLNEDGTQQSKKTFDMTDSAFGMSGPQNNVKEVHTKSNSATLKESDDDKFKKFQNAKAISSDAFRNEVKGFDSSNIKKFSGATAISSSQYFGERDEEHEDEIDYYQAAENVKDFFSTVSGKLKEKAEGVMTKIKEDWNS